MMPVKEAEAPTTVSSSETDTDLSSLLGLAWLDCLLDWLIDKSMIFVLYISLSKWDGDYSVMMR